MQNISILSLLGDNEDWYWESEPDEDWYRVEGLREDHEYTFDVETMDELPAKHQATRLKILGVYDNNGIEIPGTSSAGSGRRVSVTFQPPDADTGTFYVAVGSESPDRTGVYQIRVSSTNLLKSSNQGTRSVSQNQQHDAGEDKPDADDKSDTKEEEEAAEQNSLAQGIPAIDGTTRVGETLTVDTSNISDADGMQGVEFRYQWIAGATEIMGATGSSYRLKENDAGKTISVKVSFTDDKGNPEELTSAPTTSVELEPVEPEPVEPTNYSPSAPRNLVASASGTGILALNWDAPSDLGGSGSVKYVVLWKETSGSWNSSADVSSAIVSGTSYNISGLTPGREYVMRVFAFNDSGGGPDSDEIKGVPQ